jgi:NAD(P)-dependent dehydrogenase (short-subunit alcohol dehydrogenase family)
MQNRELAADLASRNIAVNALEPGYLPTRMTSHFREDEQVDPQLAGRIPMGRSMDVAGAAILLCSLVSAYFAGCCSRSMAAWQAAPEPEASGAAGSMLPSMACR